VITNANDNPVLSAAISSTDAAFAQLLTGYSGKNMGKSTSFTIAGLSPGATYYARVRAFDAAGNT
jgi:hypothetical protein